MSLEIEVALDASQVTRGPARREAALGMKTRRSRSERSLVRAARRGDADAWTELFDRHWPLAHRAAYLVVHDVQAAEDIAQEAFLAALRSLDRFDARRPFAPWLHRIAVNRAIDRARSVALRREDWGEAPDFAAPHAPAELEDPDLLAALAALDPERRAIVVMRHVLDFTPREIATALELPRGTVSSRLHRALDELAATLEDTR